MGYVGGIVHTEADGNYNVDHGDVVDVDVPEEKEADDVDKGDGDAAEDHQAYKDVGEEEEGDGKDTGHGETNVPP